MKLDIINIAIIMITCVSMPFFLLALIAFIENHRLIRKFNGEAKKFKVNIEKKEFWNQSILGIDPVQNKLLFVQKRNDTFAIELIDLFSIRESKLIPVSVRSHKYRKNGYLLKRIDLQLTLESQGTKLLNFYDSRLNLYKEMELSHAEMWKSLIHKYLPTNSLT